MNRKSQLVALAVAATLGTVGACAAFAAEPAAAAPAQLGEIVVTATKRETTVQTTAASITAVTAADIAGRGLVDFRSLARSVPGISMRTSGPGQTEFEMRGLNSSGGNTSMVGFYLGEIPLSSPASAQLGKVVIDPNLYDLSRVEVLRGPQGTLYGASSMGGTVRLVPNQPELSSFDATGEEVVSDTGDGGSLNHKENGMLNLPLGDTAALRVVGSFDRDSGWIKRLVLADGAVAVDSQNAQGMLSRPGNFYGAPLQEEVDGVNTTDVDSVRASVLWKPTDNLSIVPAVMYQLTRQGAPDTVDVAGNSSHPTRPAVPAHWEIYDTSEPQRDRFTLGSLTVNYTLPWFTITSATGYWNRGLMVSQDGTEEDASAVGASSVYDPPAGIGPTGPSPTGPGAVERDYTRQTSEELRLTSNGSGRLQWLLGWFYQDLHSDWDLWVINPQAAAPETAAGLAAIGLTPGPNIFVALQPQLIDQNAEFGELSYQITSKLKATAGLRHYHYSLNQHNSEWGLFTINTAVSNTLPYDTSFSNGANGVVPKFDLQYQINSDDMVYLTVSKGFRLGGVNQPIPVASPATSTNIVIVGNECGLQAKLVGTTTCNPNTVLQAPASFGNDTVWNYEVGEKSSFFDDRMQLDITAYYERWLNPQMATNLAGFGITANGGNAGIKGVEAQLQALLTEDWDIALNYGYTDAKFTESSPIIGFPEGLAIPDTPKSTASAILHYHHNVTDRVSLFGSLEWDYVGSRTDAPYGETITLQNYGSLLVQLPSYNLGNLRAGLKSDRWTAALFIDNVTDKEALLDPEPQIVIQSAAYTRFTVTRPRTIGVDLTYQFR